MKRALHLSIPYETGGALLLVSNNEALLYLFPKITAAAWARQKLRVSCAELRLVRVGSVWADDPEPVGWLVARFEHAERRVVLHGSGRFGPIDLPDAVTRGIVMDPVRGRQWIPGCSPRWDRVAPWMV